MTAEAADFNAIIETHNPRVFNLAFRVTGNRQDPQELLRAPLRFGPSG